MKNILIHLDNKDYELLQEVKGKRSWRDLLLINIIPKDEN